MEVCHLPSRVRAIPSRPSLLPTEIILICLELAPRLVMQNSRTHVCKNPAATEGVALICSILGIDHDGTVVTSMQSSRM
jgi:hypothetical protein